MVPGPRGRALVGGRPGVASSTRRSICRAQKAMKSASSRSAAISTRSCVSSSCDRRAGSQCAASDPTTTVRRSRRCRSWARRSAKARAAKSSGDRDQADDRGASAGVGLRGPQAPQGRAGDLGKDMRIASKQALGLADGEGPQFGVLQRDQARPVHAVAQRLDGAEHGAWAVHRHEARGAVGSWLEFGDPPRLQTVQRVDGLAGTGEGLSASQCEGRAGPIEHPRQRIFSHAPFLAADAVK